MLKMCVACSKVKDISEFNKNKLTFDGYRTECKECRKKRYQDNKKTKI